MAGQLLVKRVYDDADGSDGYRILADRLWPRGVSKERAKIDLWIKDLTPSDQLRKRYHDNDLDYKRFASEYRQELDSLSPDLADLKSIKDKLSVGPVTCVTSVKDIEHSHIPTLSAYLLEMTSRSS